MLHHSRISYLIHTWAKQLIAFSAAIVTAVAAASKLPENGTLGPIYEATREHAVNWGPALIILFVGVGFGCRKLQEKIGSPDVWEILYSLIDDVRNDVFPEARYGDNASEHRVTLFHCRCYRNKWHLWGLIKQMTGMDSNLLVPIVRSGHTMQRSTAVFQVDTDSEEKCEGVAGKAWFKNRVVSVSDLPLVDDGTPNRLVDEYARGTFVAAERVREKRGKPRCRSIYAIPITRKGAPWGVLVFDSTNPIKIDHEEVSRLCRLLANHISHITEKIL